MPTLLEEARLAVSPPGPAARMAIRQAAHISRERIAEELGCSVVSVIRWKQGTRIKNNL